MAKKQDFSEKLLTDLLILQLGLAGVGQVQVRKIVGCSMNRVNEILKHVKKEGEKKAPKKRARRNATTKKRG